MISLERKIKIKIFIGKIQLFTTVYFWTDKFASISSNSISWIIVIPRCALSIESVFCKESTLKVERLISCWSVQTPENLLCHLNLYICDRIACNLKISSSFFFTLPHWIYFFGGTYATVYVVIWSAFLSPSGDLGIGLVWDNNRTPPDRTTLQLFGPTVEILFKLN